MQTLWFKVEMPRLVEVKSIEDCGLIAECFDLSS